MGKIACLLIGLIVLASCKEIVEEGTEEIYERDETVQIDAEMDQAETSYPAELIEVFDAHGGLQQWRQMNNLCYELEGRDGAEIHTIALPDRQTKIESKDWAIGSTGKLVWLLQRTPDAYKGNARFYHNLMFYFYAMPFVLSDPGIVYEILPETTLEGLSYGGIQISYEQGVGDSPEDEYRIYYHPETYKMAWLGYTVTYKDQQKSDDWHFIKYADWQEINGLLLPEKLSWYAVENGLPSQKRNEMSFEKVTVTETVLEDSVFEKPESAVIVPR
ncbi:MAG: hypothetical protein CMC08_03465 [Flavobacteriaceae bacterium]|nr:hypothetical protein [Flavobacteriaceae bacterium]